MVAKLHSSLLINTSSSDISLIVYYLFKCTLHPESSQHIHDTRGGCGCGGGGGDDGGCGGRRGGGDKASGGIHP